MFFAQKGNGAYLNNSRIRVSKKSDFKNSLFSYWWTKNTSKKRDDIFNEYKKFLLMVNSQLENLEVLH